MRKVAVVGIGTLPWYSRYADKSFRALALEATKKALQEAGLTSKDVDNVVYSISREPKAAARSSDS